MALIKCENCGESISDLAEKCPKCGKVVKGIVCKECGDVMPANANSCSTCGCPLNAKTPAPVNQSPRPIGVPPVVSKKRKNSIGTFLGIIGAIIGGVLIILIVFPLIFTFIKDIAASTTATQEQTTSSIAVTEATQEPVTEANVTQPPTTQASQAQIQTPDFNKPSESKLLGYKLTQPFVTMSFDNTSWSDTIKPTITDSVYSYLTDKDNESYFWISGNIKNTGNAGYSYEDIVAEITFDNKYTYFARLVADDGSSDLYGDYLTPFQSATYYIYTSVPDELKNSYTTVTVKFGFCENFSGSYYDNFYECDYLYQVNLKK